MSCVCERNGEWKNGTKSSEAKGREMEALHGTRRNIGCNRVTGRTREDSVKVLRVQGKW